jgi:hypothetical protein
MTVSWYDATYDTGEWSNSLTDSDGVEVTSYCAPSITFLDVLDGDAGWDNHNGVAEVILGKSSNGAKPSPGMVSKTIEFTSTIRDDNPIHDFPFDYQALTVELEMNGTGTRKSKDFRRYFVPVNVSVNNKHKMLTWNYHRAVTHITASTIPPPSILLVLVVVCSTCTEH